MNSILTIIVDSSLNNIKSEIVLVPFLLHLCRNLMERNLNWNLYLQLTVLNNIKSEIVKSLSLYYFTFVEISWREIYTEIYICSWRY